MGATVWPRICSRHEVRGTARLAFPPVCQRPVGPLDRDRCHPGHRRHRVCSSPSSTRHLSGMQQKSTCQVRHRPDPHFANKPLLYNNNSSTSNNYHNNIRNNNHNYNFNYYYNNNYNYNYYNNYYDNYNYNPSL